MKYLFLLLTFMSFQPTFAQAFHIPDTNLSIEMPNDKWVQTSSKSANGMAIYFYKRYPILDSQNRQVTANISLIVEDDSLDVVDYSTLKRTEMPFEVDKVLTAKKLKMKYKNTLGFLGNYEDKYGKHTIYVIFMVNGQKGIRVICDVLTELFDRVQPEFEEALKSIK